MNWSTKTALVAALLVAGVPAMSAQISLGLHLGAPPPPRVVRVHPGRPGPGYLWVDGYWYPVGGHYRWHEGYWTLPPYDGATWIGPRYEGGEFFNGYWNGDRGRFEHDHRWDRDRGRDAHRFRDDHDRH